MHRGGTPERGARGGGRGDRGGRGHGGGGSRGGRGGGRGRGGTMTNFTGVSLDYDQLSSASLGYAPAPPPPVFPYVATPPRAYPPTPPSASPSQSGYNTPKRGLAFNPSARGGRGDLRGRGRGGEQRGAFGGGGRGSPAFGGGGRGSPAFGGGRGGIGGLGFHNPIVAQTFGGGARGGMGAARPLLVPVAFVRASALPPGLGGDEEDESMEMEPKVGDLEDQVMEGALVEVVQELGISSDDEDVMEVDEMLQLKVEPATPERVPLQIPSGFVLGLSTQPPTDSDEEEEIVFHPSGPSITASPSSVPAAPVASPPTPASLPAAPLPAPTPAATILTPTAATLPTPTLAAPLPTPTAAPAPAPLPNPPLAPKQVFTKVPPPKLSKSQKKAAKAAGKKARKNGTTHARSGNRHLFVAAPLDESDESDEDMEDVKAGEAMFAKLGAGGMEDLGMGGGVEESEPRVGDSDLEWGENGPGVEEKRQGRGRGRKNRRKREREERREEGRMERLSIGARGEVALALGVGMEKLVLRREEVVVEVRGRRDGLDEAARDYAENVMAGGEEGDMSFLLGMERGAQKTIDELDDEERARVEEEEGGTGWRTTDESESGNDAPSGEEEEESDEEADSDDVLETEIALGEADAEVDLAFAAAEDSSIDNVDYLSSDDSDEGAAIERALVSGETIRFASMGKGGPGGRRDQKARKSAKKGKEKMVESSSSDDSSDDDDGMFRGKGTWADDDEDYVRGVQDILDENADLLDDRKNRKKLFKAVENGDFRGYDFDDDIVVSGRKSKSKPSASGSFASDLQAQWEKDRSKKGDYKRARALARAEAEEASPHLSKKGARPPLASAGSSDVATINYQIREFLLHDIGRNTLSLPPMSKKSRVAVHLLCEVYGLKSKSLGKGKARFPVLERTSKTGTYRVDERRITAILGTAAGERSGGGYGGGKAKGKMGGLWAALSGEKGGGGSRTQVKPNRDGGVVGEGAASLGEGNVGFALLKKMGWTEGSQIGVSGGISIPIEARIKTSKGGLGSFQPWA